MVNDERLQAIREAIMAQNPWLKMEGNHEVVNVIAAGIEAGLAWAPQELAFTRVLHAPGCVGDQDEGVTCTVSSNAAPGVNYRSYRRYTCTFCGQRTEWVRIDPWRFKYPDTEEGR